MIFMVNSTKSIQDSFPVASSGNQTQYRYWMGPNLTLGKYLLSNIHGHNVLFDTIHLPLTWSVLTISARMLPLWFFLFWTSRLTFISVKSYNHKKIALWELLFHWCRPIQSEVKMMKVIDCVCTEVLKNGEFSPLRNKILNIFQSSCKIWVI